MKINQLCVFVGTRQGVVLFFFKSFGYLCSFADWEGVGHTCTRRWWELDLKARPIVCFPPNVTSLGLGFLLIFFLALLPAVETSWGYNLVSDPPLHATS